MNPAALSPQSFAPLAVARRSGYDESIHLGAGIVLDPDGRVAASIGDPEVGVYPRSSLKILQATAMVDAGLDLPAPLLALVAASHNGERDHLEGVAEILGRHDLRVDDLGNTPTLPYGVDARAEAIRVGAAPSSLMQNCSGKHAGMLATCRVNGWPIDDYLDPEHPVQLHIAATVESLGASVIHAGVDGCGAPAHVLSLHGAAEAIRRVALDRSGVLDAMRAHPDLVGGTGRDVTDWMGRLPDLAAKDGAAGVMALVVASGERRGWTAVYKIADGSDEARRAVVPAALEAMGIEVPEGAGPPVTVFGGGRPVGAIDPVPWV